MTINSSDELETFKSSLGSEHYTFVELVTTSENWLENACATGVRCDVLLISGHFGREFFSDRSPLRLPLGELEKNSCLSECTGIFHSPLEVFLLGCNTLSDRAPDHRTRAEYYDVLRRDGFSPESAERATEARYGILGMDHRGRMRNIFSGVPNIYGFSSTPPGGKKLAAGIRSYLQRIPDYRTHLEILQAKRLQQTTMKVNAQLAAGLSGTSFTQCSGRAEGGERRIICELIDPKTARERKISLLQDLVEDEGLITVIPLLIEAQRRGDLSADVLRSALGDNKVLRSQTISILQTLKHSPLLIPLSSFALDLGWINQERVTETVKSFLRHEFSNPVDAECADRICTLPESIRRTINIQEFPRTGELVSSTGGVRVMSCLNKVESPDYFRHAVQALRNAKDDEHRKQLL